MSVNHQLEPQQLKYMTLLMESSTSSACSHVLLLPVVLKLQCLDCPLQIILLPPLLHTCHSIQHIRHFLLASDDLMSQLFRTLARVFI